MNNNLTEPLKMNAESINALITDTQREVKDFLEYAQALENPTPELQKFASYYQRAIQRIKALHDGISKTTPTIRALTATLEVCLPALNAIADTEITPNGNNYIALKEASRTANQARIQAAKLLPKG